MENNTYKNCGEVTRTDAEKARGGNIVTAACPYCGAMNCAHLLGVSEVCAWDGKPDYPPTRLRTRLFKQPR